MLGSILKQLLQRDGIPEPLRQVFRKEKIGFGGRALQLVDLVRILGTTITSLPEVFICIDGLDECLPKHRRELLESLRDIVRASPTTRVFLSGRPHICDEVKKYFTDATMIAIVPTVWDIERYLEMRLDQDPTPSAMDDDLKAEILSVIPRKISQMWAKITTAGLVGHSLITEYRFLLVSLNIDAVLEEVTIHQRKKRLDEMVQGNGLQSAYSATLTRIKAQKGSRSRLGMEALMWLSHSERPLNANELCDALGVEIGCRDLNSQNIPSIETLLGCSQGLVIVEASSYTVRLVHYTLKEYLSNNNDLFHRPHSMIAEVCLTYLNFQCIRDLPPTLGWPKSTKPLLEYASYFWGTHAKKETTEIVNTLALQLLVGFDKHVASGILSSRHADKWGWSDPPGFTGLHCAAYFGVVEIAVGLLEVKEWDLNATDVAGNTAILLAAFGGHVDFVKMLLALGDVAPDTADKHGRTPLFHAVLSGCKDTMKVLLERGDVAPDTVDRFGDTPLMWAAGDGYEDIVEMLLQRENVTLNTTDHIGLTPLSMAAMDGHVGVLKIILQREDGSLNTADESGLTPLSHAAAGGHVGVVKVLLDREDVTLNTTDESGRTPLSWAAGYGYMDIVEMLLEREDIALNTPDETGRTPLAWAAGNGHMDTVEILLSREDVARNAADENGRTPFSWAAGNGYMDTVEMLLGWEDVARNIADEDGRTPFSWAAGNGHMDTVEMLLELEDVALNTADEDGRTPLSWAAGNGRMDTTEMLLSRAPTADENRRVPLSWAAGNRHEDVVKMLLEREDITPNSTDKNGRVPLWWAAHNGHEGIVAMLLEREDTNPDIADKDGRTALSSAAEHQHTRIVDLLLQRRCFNQDVVMTDLTSQTAFIHTSGRQQAGTLKRPLENQGSVPESAGSNSSIGHFPAESSESPQHLSKRARRS